MPDRNINHNPQTTHHSKWRPWQVSFVPILLAFLFVVVGVPLFLRMPLWCDISLYDLAARATLTGGVHYRDVFDTNLPGYVWLLAVIRSLVGWSSEALRAVDLGVFAAILLVLDRTARLAGATRHARWWVIAGACAFYPFTTEFVHAQRDVWQALPVVLAVHFRLRRIVTMGEHPRTGGAFAAGVLEGLLWGVAVWIKPHVLTVAAPVWLLTAARLAGQYRRPWRAVGADLLGNVAGGAALGAAGVAQLVTTGTWPHFWAVMTEWNPAYSQKAFIELSSRAGKQLYWFPPWSWFLPLSVGLSVLAILDARPWSRRFRDGTASPARWALRNLVVFLLMVPLAPIRLVWLFAVNPVAPFVPAWAWAVGDWLGHRLHDPTTSDRMRFVRCGLAVTYLTWAAQAFILQRGFHYVHVTEIFLMLALWSAHRWCLPAFVLSWLAVTTVVMALAGPPSKPGEPPGEPGTALADWIERFEEGVVGRRDWYNYYFVSHPIADGKRMKWWPVCFRFGLSPADRLARADALREMRDFEASTNWTQLDEVAAFLRSRGVADHQLVAWHDSTHPLYLLLNVKPGLRFMHVNTAASIDPERSPELVLGELNRNTAAKYVVADIESMAYFAEESYGVEGAYKAWWEPPTDPALPLPPAPLRVATIRGIRVNDFEFPFDRDPHLPPDSPKRYPFDRRPVLFRSKGGTGRYVVFELRQPINAKFERP